jgi:site-specific recombinase XerD
MFLSKRNGVYHLFYEDATGKRFSRSTGTRTKGEALVFLRSFNAEQDAKERSIRDVTLEAFETAFLPYSKSVHTPKTVAANKTALNEFKKHLGSRRILRTINAADCERFVALKTAEASPWTARKYHLALGSMFERARSWGHIIDNPWRTIRKPKTPEVLPAYFAREQFRTLLAALENRDLRDLVMVAALTGMRQAELLAMRWNWIDFDRRTITIQNAEGFTTKSKRVRVVPLANEAYTILLGRRERTQAGTIRIFEGLRMTPGHVTFKVKQTIRRAGLPENLHFHSLRHTYASWLVQGGVSLYQVAKLLGHANTSTAEIYAHLITDDMHKVLAPLQLRN